MVYYDIKVRLTITQWDKGGDRVKLPNKWTALLRVPDTFSSMRIHREAAKAVSEYWGWRVYASQLDSIHFTNYR